MYAKRSETSLHVAALTGKSERRQFPTSIVVTPCSGSGSRDGSQKTCGSVWACVSMNPGVTTPPPASISSSPSGAKIRTDLDDDTVADADVSPDRGCPGAVDDLAAADQHFMIRHDDHPFPTFPG